MTLFEGIEEYFQELRNLSDTTRALVTLTTAFGALILLYVFMKGVLICIRDLRLYFFAQICFKGNLRELYGNWAVVTGATDGIGLAVAKELARRGLSIILIGRNETKLANAKNALEMEPNCGEVVKVKIDLSDSSIQNYENIRDLIDLDNRDIGILVNNAGMCYEKCLRFARIDMETLKATVNVNILASVHFTRMILPGMISRGSGLVMNISSGFGQLSFPYLGLYSPTKSFMDSFSQILCAEYSSYPIHFINFTPGPVDTNMLRSISKLSPRFLSFFVPSSDTFAVSILNVASTRIQSACGVWAHELVIRFGLILKFFNLIPLAGLMHIKMNANQGEFSPPPGRRRKPFLKVNQTPDETNVVN